MLVSAGKDATSAKERRVADRNEQVRAHIRRLEDTKINLTEERAQWLQWVSFRTGLLSSPRLLILNFHQRRTHVARILGHAFGIKEADVMQEELEDLKWIVDVSLGSRDRTTVAQHRVPRTIEHPNMPSQSCRWQHESHPMGSAGQQELDSASRENSMLQSIGSFLNWHVRGQGMGSCRQQGQEAGFVEDQAWKGSPQAVLLVCGSSLSQFQELVLGTLFLQGKPVLVLAEGATREQCHIISQWTAGTWPVFAHQDALVAFLETDLPKHLQLESVIRAEVQGILARHKDLNLKDYSLTRVPLVFLPFGLSILDSVALFDLSGKCMADAGIHVDEWTQKTVARVASNKGPLELPDKTKTGNVYNLLVKEAMLTEAVQSGSVAAAVVLLTHSNLVLLGGATVLASLAHAAWTYMSRPQVVDSIANVVTMLLFTYCLNPGLRLSAPIPP